MHFLVDKKLKIIFGWSAKCGCSHIKKIFWFLQNNKIDNKIHTVKERLILPNDIENYTTILIIRNPYERIISGFLNKYNKIGELRPLWKSKTLTFNEFTDELIKFNWKKVDKHHFTPQTTETFDKNIILKSKSLKIYDIKNIDYKYIEELYNNNNNNNKNIKIPKELLEFKGGHERKSFNKSFENYVYDLDIMEYYDYDVDKKYFYNDDIKNKIYNFYKNDFIFFKEYGFDYS